MRADGASPYYAQPQAERPRRERLVSDTTLSIESRVRIDQTSLVGRDEQCPMATSDEPERNHFLYATKYLPRRDSTLYPVTVAGVRSVRSAPRSRRRGWRSIARRPKYAAQRAHHTVATCRLFMEGDGRPSNA
jgi:hypothetical protein